MNMAPNDVFNAWTSRGLVIWLQPVSCAGALRGSMVGGANQAAMSEAARRSRAEPIVPRPADDGRRTPAWFGKRPLHTRTSRMKVEELYVDT